MKSTSAIFLLLASQVALADTTQTTPVLGNYTLKRGNTTIMTVVGTMLDCEASARADAQSRAASATYTCISPETFTVTYSAAPVQCASAQPPSDAQQATCPAGSFGTFTQTRSYALQASPTCWVAGSWGPTAPAPGVCSTAPPSGTYVTTFDTNEYPLSEGGKWKKTSNVWTYMNVVNGVAFPSNGVTGGYDDSYAYLAQSFGNNYEIEGIVWRDPALASDAGNEIAFLLRTSDDSNNIRAYEVLYQAYGGLQIIRWDGPYGGYTVLPTTQPSGWQQGTALKTGDVLKASVIGNVVTMYVNGVARERATDSAFSTGQPGISGFLRPGYLKTGLGFTQIKVTAK